MQIDNYSTDVFVIVPARDGKNVPAKIKELKSIGVSFKIICGEHFDHPNVVYRENNGKWDALNFGASFVPKETRVVALNDVDTQICNFEDAITHLNEEVGLVYCKVNVAEGPQVKFYRIMDQLRQRFHIAASGELMLIDRRLFDRLIPVPPCIAEDSYILFKALETGTKAHFSTTTYVKTQRTSNSIQETKYKNRTTLGIYQALDFAKPPPEIRLFYMTLPLFAPLLTLAGKDGEAWMVGIQKGFRDHLQNKDQTKF